MPQILIPLIGPHLSEFLIPPGRQCVAALPGEGLKILFQSLTQLVQRDLGRQMRAARGLRDDLINDAQPLQIRGRQLHQLTGLLMP